MKKQYPQVFFEQKLKRVQFPLCIEQNTLKKLKYKKKKRRDTECNNRNIVKTHVNLKQNIYYKQIQQLSSNLSIKRTCNSQKYDNKQKMPKIQCYRNSQKLQNNENQIQIKKKPYASQHAKYCTLGMIKKQKNPIIYNKTEKKVKRTLSNFKLQPISQNAKHSYLKSYYFQTEHFQSQQKIVQPKTKFILSLQRKLQQQQIKPWQLFHKQILEQDQYINFDIF